MAAIDAEVVTSLALGGPFAGAPYLEERLQGLAGHVAGFEVGDLGAWVRVSVMPVEPAEESAVRVYARAGSVSSLVWSHQARGTLRAETVPSRGEPRRLLLVWEDHESPPAARDVTAMVLALAPRPVVIWRSTDAGPAGAARDAVYRDGELRVRRAGAYPGSGAGCDRATERVEIYRVDPGGRLDAAGGQVVLARVDTVEPWHRELREVVARVFARSVGGEVRRDGVGMLPRSLEQAPVCDRVEGTPPMRARVGATDAGGRAWWLAFERRSSGWRLANVLPVLD